MSRNPELTESDEQLAHIVYDHLLPVFQEVLVAYTETVIYNKFDDPRFEKLATALEGLSTFIDGVVNDAMDDIPGTLTREEADLKVTEFFERAALLKGLPADSFLPENLPLQ